MPFDPISYSQAKKASKPDISTIDDIYIQEFKNKNPKAARLLTSADILIDTNRLTVGDVINYINSVPGMITPTATLIGEVWRPSLSASVLNSSSLSISNCATILNSTTVSVSKASSIFNDTNISASRIHSILSDANIGANKVQSILYQMVNDGYWSRLLEIITCTASDTTISANTTISGTNRYKTLTINSGITLTVDGQPGIIIAESISNSGIITKTATGGSGGGGATSGGRGGGELIIVAKQTSGGSYYANGAGGGYGQKIYSGGGAGAGGVSFRVGTDTFGNGGSGNYNGGSGATLGGGGGGGAANNYGGPGASVTLINYTYDSYSLIADRILKATVDWYIKNILSKSPSSTISFPNAYGAGGGGGAGTDASCGGGGGGSGGVLVALTLSINGGTFCAKGGNGGNVCAPNQSGGGGGGGGGLVYVLVKSVTTAPTLDASGGAGGTNTNYPGGAGTAGTAKYVVI